MPLVDDGIKYKSKDKSKGYELIDGKKYTGIGFNPPSAGRSKKNTPLLNYSTVTDFVPKTVIKSFTLNPYPLTSSHSHQTSQYLVQILTLHKWICVCLT